MPIYDFNPKGSFIDLVYEQKNILEKEKESLQLKLDIKDHVVRRAIEKLDHGHDRREVMKLLKTILEDK